MSKEPRFTESSNSRFRAPEAPPVAATASLPTVDWQDMDSAPKTGGPLLLTPDLEQAHEAVWRSTREYSPSASRFVDVGFWAVRNAGGRKIGFEPLGWRPAQ